MLLILTALDGQSVLLVLALLIALKMVLQVSIGAFHLLLQVFGFLLLLRLLNRRILVNI